MVTPFHCGPPSGTGTSSAVPITSSSEVRCMVRYLGPKAESTMRGLVIDWPNLSTTAANTRLVMQKLSHLKKRTNCAVEKLRNRPTPHDNLSDRHRARTPERTITPSGCSQPNVERCFTTVVSSSPQHRASGTLLLSCHHVAIYPGWLQPPLRMRLVQRHR